MPSENNSNVELERKVASIFAGKVVGKDLVRKVKVGANVPVFVLEYLLSKYCATDDVAALEAGLRGTGKSYAYQELSPYTILLTGPTTVANLFYNMATNKMGLVGIWDAIAFDEVADLQKMPKEVITTLKTYGESGSFARGKESLSGMASMAMFGNTNQPVEVMVRSSHLFLPMPDVIREDMAFFDRIHFYLPDWEIPKMRMDNGARRALIPLENKRHFLEVAGDILERFDPIFFSDPMTAAMKALGMT